MAIAILKGMDVLLEELLFLGVEKKLDANGVQRTSKEGTPLYTVTAFQASSGRTLRMTVEGEPPSMEVTSQFKVKGYVGTYNDRLWIRVSELIPNRGGQLPSLPPKRPVV